MTDNKTDVIICGSGSAGLCAAVWLSRYNIHFKILERRPGPLDVGQADGVQTRTVEIFDSLGIGEDLLKEAYHVMELAFWNSEGDPEGKIRRSHFAPDKEPALSHRPHVILNQARMHALLLSQVKENSVEYGCEVTGVEVDSEAAQSGSHCVKVTARKGGKEQVWRAKYVLGCDGAHSTVRRSLGFKMIGDSTDAVWGVMDVFPRTDFPDIRKKCLLLSSAGNMVIIPREGDYMVRLYMELPTGTEATHVTLEDLHQLARRIFHPHTMDIANTTWWSVYVIGQRLADRFHQDYRVFLTGDACHTHSPKAGQGMNVSLQDGYNIGWKLGHVLTGRAVPEILQTYVSERQSTAEELIKFDTYFTRVFSSKYRKEHGVSAEHFAEQFVKSGRYTAGQGIRYGPSLIVQPTQEGSSSSPLAGGFVVGTRFPSAQAVRYSDAKTVQLLSELKSNGSWHVVVFAGDLCQAGDRERLRTLSGQLQNIAGQFTTADVEPDSVIESILVLRMKRVDIQAEWIPGVFTPVGGKWKIKCLHKVFVDDESYDSGHGHAFEKYGIDPSRNDAIVVVRPDQYIAKICSFNEVESIRDFFLQFLSPAKD
ncbi:FAD binding domain-containing protein [Biscogniauxia mediterranea]|nr:FAD binding domain-containing protein [Biscogniauxia mediterranea]